MQGRTRRHRRQRGSLLPQPVAVGIRIHLPQRRAALCLDGLSLVGLHHLPLQTIRTRRGHSTITPRRRGPPALFLKAALDVHARSTEPLWSVVSVTDAVGSNTFGEQISQPNPRFYEATDILQNKAARAESMSVRLASHAPGLSLQL